MSEAENATMSVIGARKIVGALAALDVEVPAELAEAVAARDIADRLATPPSLNIDALIDDASADQIEAVVDEIANAHAVREARRKVMGPVLEVLGRRVIRTMRTSADAVLAAVEPKFTIAAKKFHTAFVHLPPEALDDPALLLQAGHTIVRQWEAALDARNVLDQCAAVRDAYANHAFVADGPATIELATRFAVFPSNAQAQHAAGQLHAHRARGLGRWGILASHGATLTWQTLDDQATHIATLQTTTTGPRAA